MYRTILSLAVLCLLLVGCATDSGGRQARSERYNAAASEPIDRIRAFHIYGWTPIDRNQLVLWARPKEAYLIDFYAPCVGLDFTNQIGLSHFGNTIYARTDSILVPHDRCRIERIRPIDHEKLVAERHRMKLAGDLEARDENLQPAD